MRAKGRKAELKGTGLPPGLHAGAAQRSAGSEAGTCRGETFCGLRSRHVPRGAPAGTPQHSCTEKHAGTCVPQMSARSKPAHLCPRQVHPQHSVGAHPRGARLGTHGCPHSPAAVTYTHTAETRGPRTAQLCTPACGHTRDRTGPEEPRPRHGHACKAWGPQRAPQAGDRLETARPLHPGAGG